MKYTELDISVEKKSKSVVAMSLGLGEERGLTA